MTSNIQDFRRPEGRRYVGSAQRRIDGKLKVTGGARYSCDRPITASTSCERQSILTGNGE